MPQPGERYNRFMKFLAPFWSNDKRDAEGSGFMQCDWMSECEICHVSLRRNQLKLISGKVKCRECIDAK